PSDCAGASSFQEEALVELRNARTPGPVFTLAPSTAALEVRWSLKPGSHYVVPITQVAAPPFDYGVSPEIAALTPPGPGGVYAPGADITFQITLRDGAGNRLHPPGSLPSYNDVVSGQDETGIQYYRAFFDPTTTDYRRKHRERMLMAQIIGPMQDVQPIRTVVDLSQFADPVITIGTPSRDGVFSQANTFPSSDILFNPAAWSSLASDTWTYHLPADAAPGTYRVTLKGRRVYYGEDIPFTKQIDIQVGTAVPTSATLSTGPCNTCHTGGGALSEVLHANSDRAACAGCHAPLSFELEGPIHVRVHFIHGRSDRVDAPPARCDACHLTADGITRTSKA